MGSMKIVKTVTSLTFLALLKCNRWVLASDWEEEPIELTWVSTIDKMGSNLYNVYIYIWGLSELLPSLQKRAYWKALLSTTKTLFKLRVLCRSAVTEYYKGGFWLGAALVRKELQMLVGCCAELSKVVGCCTEVSKVVPGQVAHKIGY